MKLNRVLSLLIFMDTCLPAAGVETYSMHFEHDLAPLHLQWVRSMPLYALEDRINYDALYQGTLFYINDYKGFFTVTQVTPYEKHWLTGLLGVTQQYKYFERPRFFHSEYFPYPLVTEYGYVKHIKNDGQSRDIKVSSLKKWPTRYGWGAIAGGTISGIVIGWLASLIFFGKNNR